MPHRLSKVDASDEPEIRALIASMGEGDTDDTAALAALQEIIQQPEASCLSPEVLIAIRAALEAAGVVFTNGEEPGVKLRKADM